MALTVEVMAAGSGKQVIHTDIDNLAIEAAAEDAQTEVDGRTVQKKLIVVNWDNAAAVVVEDTP